MSSRAVGRELERLRAVADLDGLTGPVVVGCSGGPDSSALLVLAADAGLAPVAVHVDHGLRPGSADDVEVVRDLARRLRVPCHEESVTVAPGSNLEARARDARHSALERARLLHRASWTLVGHTADDQAETVLVNLLRGSGSAGLAGMAPRRDRLARPLLPLRRADTRALCESLGLTTVDDPMNRDRSFQRVAVRADVLPLLGAVARRDLVPVLARQAEILREESEFLDELARAAWPGAAGDDAPARALAALPAPLARRAVRQWLGAPPPSRADVDRIVAIANGECRAVELAGGRRVHRHAGQLVLSGG
jgi:tRNA(Ile)-lysidine synthase